MNTKQNESRIQNDLLDYEALVFLKIFISSFCIAPLVVSGLRELSFPSGYPEKDLEKKKKKANRF